MSSYFLIERNAPVDSESEITFLLSGAVEPSVTFKILMSHYQLECRCRFVNISTICLQIGHQIRIKNLNQIINYTRFIPFSELSCLQKPCRWVSKSCYFWEVTSHHSYAHVLAFQHSTGLIYLLRFCFVFSALVESFFPSRCTDCYGLRLFLASHQFALLSNTIDLPF